MIFFGLLYLFSLAAIITFIFTKLLRVRGPWGSFWTFFSVTLLAILAADLWIEPIGPFYGEIYWLPPLIVGIIIAFLLAATSPPAKPIDKLKEPFNEIVEEQSKTIALGTFFWFLLILMLILIVLGFLNSIQ
jgi:hypothetical protein